MAVFSFAHSRHSGKPLSHGRTSYASLAFLLMMCGVLLSTFSLTASAASPVPKADNPQGGSIGLSGAVRGPAPTSSAIILVPSNGFRFSQSPITVSGTCPLQTFVNIYRNGVLSGATTCLDDGTFSLLIDLVSGQNQLQAKVTDALNQSGPDSPNILVFYTPAIIGGIGSNVGATPLIITTDHAILGVSPGQSLQRDVRIIGGVGPYAVSWDFGDGTIVANPQANAGEATISHKYERPGTYKVVVRVTDSTGNTAIIQLVAVVNGPTSGALSTTRNSKDVPGILAGLWPLYLLAVIMVVTFWLGERRELYELRRHHRLNTEFS